MKSSFNDSLTTDGLVNFSFSAFQAGKYGESFESMRRLLEVLPPGERNDPRVLHNFNIICYNVSRQQSIARDEKSGVSFAESAQMFDASEEELFPGISSYNRAIDYIHKEDHKLAALELQNCLQRHASLDPNSPSLGPSPATPSPDRLHIDDRVSMHMVYLLVDTYIDLHVDSRDRGEFLLSLLNERFSDVQRMALAGTLGSSRPSTGSPHLNLAEVGSNICPKYDSRDLIASKNVWEYTFLYHLYKAKIFLHFFKSFRPCQEALHEALRESGKLEDRSSSSSSSSLSSFSSPTVDSSLLSFVSAPSSPNFDDLPAMVAQHCGHFLNGCAFLFLKAHSGWLEGALGSSISVLHSIHNLSSQLVRSPRDHIAVLEKIEWQWLNALSILQFSRGHLHSAVWTLCRAIRQHPQVAKSSTTITTPTTNTMSYTLPLLLRNLSSMLTALNLHHPWAFTSLWMSMMGGMEWNDPLIWMRLAQHCVNIHQVKVRHWAHSKQQKRRNWENIFDGRRNQNAEEEDGGVAGSSVDYAAGGTSGRSPVFANISSLLVELLKVLSPSTPVPEPTLELGLYCCDNALQIILLSHSNDFSGDTKARQSSSITSSSSIRSHILLLKMYICLCVDDPYAALRCFALLYPSLYRKVIALPISALTQQSSSTSGEMTQSVGGGVDEVSSSSSAVASARLTYISPQSGPLCSSSSGDVQPSIPLLEYLAKVYAGEALCMLGQVERGMAVWHMLWVRASPPAATPSLAIVQHASDGEGGSEGGVEDETVDGTEGDEHSVGARTKAKSVTDEESKGASVLVSPVGVVMNPSSDGDAPDGSPVPPTTLSNPAARLGYCGASGSNMNVPFRFDVPLVYQNKGDEEKGGLGSSTKEPSAIAKSTISTGKSQNRDEDRILDLASSPLQRNILFNLGLAATALGDHVGARLYFAQAMPHGSQSTAAFFAAVSAELNKGNCEPVLQYLKPRWPRRTKSVGEKH